MGKQEVATWLNETGRNDLTIIEFPVSSATVELAAKAAGVAPELIAKTIACRLKDRDIIVVVSGTARLSNRKFKETFGCKVKMLSPEEAKEITGHAVGGVCPFGLKTPLPVYLDKSMAEFEYVYPAAGEPNNALKIKTSEFAELCGGKWTDLTE
jgi:Cys-tRNA(Pro) deacylase